MSASSRNTPVQADSTGDRRGRLRLGQLWLVPGLAIALAANNATHSLGTGILPLLAFGIAPDLPRLLSVIDRRGHDRMTAVADRAFNLMHHPAPPIAVLALAAASVVPPILSVGALAWLSHIVVGLGLGDRMRRPENGSGRIAGSARPRSASRADDRPAASGKAAA